MVATLDSGTNPFHPCFRRDWGSAKSPRTFIPNYPKNAVRLPLQMKSTYDKSLKANASALDSIKPNTLHYVPGTNLSFYGEGANANKQFVDTEPHGAKASSQIACEKFGMGSNAHLVIINWINSPKTPGQLLDWVAKQDWIDVVHLNIQDIVPLPVESELTPVVKAGKLVVVAAGNGWGGGSVGYPTEVDRYPGPPGTLLAGANDNDGWTTFSNNNPHVVMDGGETIAAAPDSYGEDRFDGTSSASPRITGYVAQVLGRLRKKFGHTWRGLVTIPANRPRPESGPLSDGKLTAAELHEAIRKTADPHSHESRYDGARSIYWMPEPPGLPFAFYPKVGYGEISEHTIDLAVRVLAGEAPMPSRPDEDRFYEQSESIRAAIWGLNIQLPH